jgi:hypothetical protein
MGWATSVIRFDRNGDFLRLSCLSLKDDAFSSELDSLLIDWTAQRNLCSSVGSTYRNTQLNDLIVVSPGLLANDLVREGIRYPARPPHCGWWLHGGDYRGDLSTQCARRTDEAPAGRERLKHKVWSFSCESHCF